MKYYIFYSDYNDSYNRNIPREVRDEVEYYDKPLPEQYRDKRYDVFITDITELLPQDWQHYKSVQMWYSGKYDVWKYDIYWTNDVEEMKLIKEKYMDTFKEVALLPSYAPTDFFHALIECVFLDYYDDIKETFERYNIKFNSKPPVWGRGK